MISLKCLENPSANWPKQKPVPKLPWFDIPAKIRDSIIERMDFATRWSFFVCSELTTMFHMPENSVRSLQVKDNNLRIYLANRAVHPTLAWDTMQFNDLAATFARIAEKNPSSMSSIIYHDEWHYSTKKSTVKNLEHLKSVDLSCGHNQIGLSGFIGYDQLALVSGNATIKHLEMKAEQLAKFQAESINLRSTKATSEDINQYLKMFVSGQTSGRLKKIIIDISGSDNRFFTQPEIMSDLDVLGKKSQPEFASFALVSPANTCRIAVVNVWRQCMTIETFSKQEFDGHKEHFGKYGALVNDYVKDSFTFLGHDDLVAKQ